MRACVAAVAAEHPQGAWRLRLLLDAQGTPRAEVFALQPTVTPVRLRLERFVEYYPSVLGAGRQKPTVVDMRYPNGFALHLAAATPGSEKKGKP